MVMATVAEELLALILLVGAPAPAAASGSTASDPFLSSKPLLAPTDTSSSSCSLGSVLSEQGAVKTAMEYRIWACL